MDKTGFLEESPGVKSSTRLVFLIGSFAVILMASYMCFKQWGTPEGIGVFITSSMAALVGTKYFGTKNEVK